ncbi:MAG TPA: TlpA disulfide reductase family protein [Candidatus Binataceae bacterium]|nr:TlpA disulfide reductase family protein [Candidatus Binataceae bacterium]
MQTQSRDSFLYLVAALGITAGLLMMIAWHGHHGAAVSGPGSEEAPVAAGSRAADFKLQTLDGHTISLHSLRGKVVFLNIWATWCGPCREEMPSLEALYDEFKSNPDFVMLAVSQDVKGKAAVEPYIEKSGLHFTVLLDPENEVAESYDISGVPETFVIDREGRIVAHHMGPFDWARPDVKQALQELLNSKTG